MHPYLRGRHPRGVFVLRSEPAVHISDAGTIARGRTRESIGGQQSHCRRAAYRGVKANAGAPGV
jgi:hypothetical protein